MAVQRAICYRRGSPNGSATWRLSMSLPRPYWSGRSWRGSGYSLGSFSFPQRSTTRPAHRPSGKRSKSNSPSPKRGRAWAAGGANHGRKRCQLSGGKTETTPVFSPEVFTQAQLWSKLSQKNTCQPGRATGDCSALSKLEGMGSGPKAATEHRLLVVVLPVETPRS